MLACVGTYITLGQTGVFKFFLIAPLCALIIGILPNAKATTNTTLFSLFALIYSFVFLDGSKRITAFGTMVGIILLGVLFGMFVLRSKEKKIFILPATICVFASLFVTIIVFGSPISAIVTKNELDEYISSTYTENEFIFEDYKYDGNKYGYFVTAKNDRTASGLRIYKSKGGYIVDEYMTHLKKSLMRPIVEEIISVIREKHPNDGFTIYGKEIHSLQYPLTVYDERDYSEYMDLYFYVSNEMLFEDFSVKTREYFEEIIDSGIKFNTITFIGGEKGQKIFELTAHYGYICNTFEKLSKKHDYVNFSLNYIDFK